MPFFSRVGQTSPFARPLPLPLPVQTSHSIPVPRFKSDTATLLPGSSNVHLADNATAPLPKILETVTESAAHVWNNVKRFIPFGDKIGWPSSFGPPHDIESYRTRAEALIANADTPVKRNKAITGAYAAMYLKSPDVFLWPGMAAYASEQVGMGIFAAGDVFPAEMPLVIPLRHVLDTLGLNTRRHFRDLLIAGNDGVYRDIFPVFLAYNEGGIANVNALTIDQRIKDGFKWIDDGVTAKRNGDAAKGDKLIWTGNATLLRYEQEVTLQRIVYDSDPLLWELLSPFLFMRFETGIIPDKNHWTYFEPHVPGGSVGVFSDRWQWISRSMLPLWQNLLTTESARLANDAAFFVRRGATAKGSSYDL